jgi:hypothetical protein
MLSVTELLDKAVEYDRLAARASRPKQKAQNESLAACYRYLAEQKEMAFASAEASTLLYASPRAPLTRVVEP